MRATRNKSIWLFRNTPAMLIGCMSYLVVALAAVFLLSLTGALYYWLLAVRGVW